jgi:hypothetical protein
VSRPRLSLLAFRRVALLVATACALAPLAATAARRPAPTPTSHRGVAPGTWCGGTRWRLLTMSDVDRRSVRLHSLPTSIAQISTLRPPRHFTTRRGTSFERHVWRLQTVLDRYRIASNGEIILILYSIVSNQYIDAYLANPFCLGRRARNRAALIAARDQFLLHCPRPTADWQLIGATVEVAGVGFWNPLATTRGALSNGAELRPLTYLRIIAGCGVG